MIKVQNTPPHTKRDATGTLPHTLFNNAPENSCSGKKPSHLRVEQNVYKYPLRGEWGKKQKKIIKEEHLLECFHTLDGQPSIW